MSLKAAIDQLHGRCAIFTSAPTAEVLLDLAGWTKQADLSRAVLLEPCVGEGSILIAAINRLLASLRSQHVKLNKARLAPRIKGFELHPETARTARRNVTRLLLSEGFSWGTASALADAWVVERDFLIEKPRHATHVAANPPYVRWTKLPESLATLYRSVLPGSSTRGDLAVAFLHRMQQWAEDGGIVVALVSDRWMFAQYGAAFLESSKASGWSIEVVDERPANPFVRKVGAYSAIVKLSRRGCPALVTEFEGRSTARSRHQELLARHGDLAQAGCTVRVGPALGAGRTFVLEEGDDTSAEEELIHPFVIKGDLGGLELAFPQRRVVVPYDRNGKLIDPGSWPGFARWVAKHEVALRARSHFKEGDQYWRTIDAVPDVWWREPKLLVSELCKVPVATLDAHGCVPAHSIYAIWPGEWPVALLQKVLNAGLLELTGVAEAPALKSGWMRFYKRFITRTPLPKWGHLVSCDQEDLAADDETFAKVFRRLFGFEAGSPPIR